MCYYVEALNRSAANPPSPSSFYECRAILGARTHLAGVGGVVAISRFARRVRGACLVVAELTAGQGDAVLAYILAVNSRLKAVLYVVSAGGGLQEDEVSEVSFSLFSF